MASDMSDESLFESLRGILKNELELRMHRNSEYSLRAFARDIGLPPSQVSNILRRKKGLSAARAAAVGKKLGYEELKLKWFIALADMEFGRSHRIRENARNRLRRWRNGVLSRDMTDLGEHFLLRWYHLAIRRMTSLKGFALTPEWIAGKLKIPESLAAEAIKELAENGLIHFAAGGKVTIENMHMFLQSKEGNERISRTFKKEISSQVEIREKSMAPERRHDGAHFFTVNAAQIGELKALIQEFEDRLDDLTYKSKETHDELYFLRVSLYPFI